jgi:hypothetical protein
MDIETTASARPSGTLSIAPEAHPNSFEYALLPLVFAGSEFL